MKKKLEIGNILNLNKGKLSNIGEKITFEMKKYVTAILFGTSLLISNPTKAEENKLTMQFNYKYPQKDENGFLIARTDLKDESEISDGYSSIYELFTKLNSMTKTQIEPLFEPQYIGEINKKTGEKIPTFIIVGDIHTDEYNLGEKETKQLKELLKDTRILIEKEEDSNQEIEVINLLNKKFGIKVIGLENEIYNKNNESKIGKGVNELGLNTIGLEDKKIFEEETQKLLEEENILNFEFLWLLGVDFDIKVTKDEYDKLIKDEEVIDIMKIINNEEIEETIIKDKNKSNKEKIELLMKKDFEVYKRLENNKELATKLYKILKTMTGKMYGKQALIYFLKEAKNNNLSKNIEENIRKSAENKLNSYITVIKKRNQKGIEIISNNLDEEKIAVIVYGKSHIDDLIKQLNQKYDGEVNIYVAK